MKAKTFDWILLVLAIAIGLVLFAGWQLAFAQGDHKCQGGHNCNDSGESIVDVVTGDTIVGGDDVLGISFSTGDVDISQCLASKSTPVYQWLKENKWCMADSLDAHGRHEAAAKVRCLTKTLKKAYPNRAECEAAVLMDPHITPPVEESVVIDDNGDDDYRFEELQSQIVALEQHNESAAARVAVNPVLEKQLAADATRRAKAREALKESKQ